MSSRRELSIDVAEHKSFLKNFQNTYYPRFSFILKTSIAFPKKGFAILNRGLHLGAGRMAVKCDFNFTDVVVYATVRVIK